MDTQKRIAEKRRRPEEEEEEETMPRKRHCMWPGKTPTSAPRKGIARPKLAPIWSREKLLADIEENYQEGYFTRQQRNALRFRLEVHHVLRKLDAFRKRYTEGDFRLLSAVENFPFQSSRVACLAELDDQAVDAEIERLSGLAARGASRGRLILHQLIGNDPWFR